MNETTRTAVDRLAEMIDEIVVLFADRELLLAYMKGNKGETIKGMIKNHPDVTVSLLAKIKGINVTDYTVTPIGLFSDLMSLLNNKELSLFFASYVQRAKTSVGQPTQNIEETETTQQRSVDTSKPKRKKQPKETTM